MICKKRQNTKSEKKSFGRSAFAFLLVGLICFAGVMYVFQVNQLATMGYEIDKREEKIDKLQQNKKQLEVEAAQLRSVYGLEGGEKAREMKKPEEVGVLEVKMERPVALNAD